MTNPVVPSEDEARRRRQRRNNIALGLVLTALVVIFFVPTISKKNPTLFTSWDR